MLSHSGGVVFLVKLMLSLEGFDLIPSQDDKSRSLLLDAFRILAWESFKVKQQVSGLDAYNQTFGSLWAEHPIHGLSLPELQELAVKKGYSVVYLLKYRNDYYAKKRGNSQSDMNGNVDNGYDVPAF